MASIPHDGRTGRRLSLNKLAGLAIWVVGCVMTYAALEQMTDWGGPLTFAMCVTIQFLLTKGQSPVWRGDFGIIPVTLLAIDTLINFGGCMAIFANVDQMGSMKAFTSTFFSYQGTWPMPVKGAVAVFVAAIVAGLPEYFWSKD